MLQIILAVKNSDPKTKVLQKDIAAALGVSEGYVSQIISGDATMSEEQADKVAALLKVDRALIWSDQPVNPEKVIGVLASVVKDSKLSEPMACGVVVATLPTKKRRRRPSK